MAVMEYQEKSADEPSIVDENLTPAQLLTAFVERSDQQAFAQLLQLYGKMVYGVCLRILKDHHDAEDAFQTTFVLLARNAHAIACREGITSWLHKVAYHAALKSKTINNTRKAKEVSMSGVQEPTLNERELWSELKPILDQELNQLPVKYRMPILLCDIQGKTRKEAARELGCLEATLSTRLLRAREQLAARLTRQGVVVSSAALVVVASQNVASASVPASLLASTLNAVSAVPAVQAAGAGTVIAKAISLAKGISQPVLQGKIALITATAAALSAAVVSTHFGQDEEQPSAKAAATAAVSLDDIRRGIEASFTYLRNHSIAVEYRVDFEYDAPQRDPLAFLWEEQKLVMEESENKFYGRREAIHRRPDHTDPRLTQTTAFDGQIRREHNTTQGNKGSSGFVSMGIEKTGGVWLLDRYLDKIGYAFKPGDRKNSKSDADDLQWIPACFQKAKYNVAAAQEPIDDELCYVVECPSRDKMWIDASLGFALRKRILRLPTRPGQPATSLEITNSDWERVADGLWLPRRSVVEKFAGAPGRNSQRTRLYRETLVAKSVSVDGPQPPGQYHIEFPLETFVTNLDNGTSYVVKLTGNAVVDETGEIHSPKSTDTLPSQGIASPNSKTAFAAGSNWTRWLISVNAVLFLILGGYFFYRRRFSP